VAVKATVYFIPTGANGLVSIARTSGCELKRQGISRYNSALGSGPCTTSIAGLNLDDLHDPPGPDSAGTDATKKEAEITKRLFAKRP